MSSLEHSSDILTNVALPNTEATITVRVIKSFEYRTERSLVLHNLNLPATTVGELKNIAKQAIQSRPAWKPYRNTALDTLKVYTKAHGAKTSNLIINLDHDEWILNDNNKTLAEVGFENETEVSFFNGEAYEKYKLNPEIRWDVPN
ncbi:cytoplasmic protein [Scleroderma citrinum]